MNGSEDSCSIDGIFELLYRTEVNGRRCIWTKDVAVLDR